MKCRDYIYSKVDSGTKVGRLTVMKVVGKSKNGSKLWLCLCECGNECEVISSSLNSGLKQSCGCLYDSIKGKQATTHGKSKTRTYNSWVAMRDRCNDPKNQYYELYGGRGITICDRWLESFENFYEDMGECPKGLSLERIKVDGNYEPSNCKWETSSRQGYNTRKHKNNSSGRSGVSYHNKQNRWQASIGFENKYIYLGSFVNFEDAVRARELAEIKYYGFNKE